MKLPQKFQSYAYTQIIENKSSDTGILMFMVALLSGQKVKQPKCTFNRWMDKQNVRYIYTYISIYLMITDIIHP